MLGTMGPKAALIALLLSATSVAGCGDGRAPGAPGSWGAGSSFGAAAPTWPDQVPEELTEPAPEIEAAVTDTYLSGQLGDVAPFEGEAFEAGAWVAESRTRIVLYTDAGPDVAMSALFLSGRIEDLPRGEELVFDAEGASATTTVDLFAIGCSGPDVGVWIYDPPQQGVTVRVTPNADGTLDVEYTSTHDHAGLPQQVDGRFSYAPR